MSTRAATAAGRIRKFPVWTTRATKWKSSSAGPRAVATCRSAGIALRAAPTDFWVAGDEAATRDLLPDSEALMVTHLALREHMGFWIYQRRGWIR